MKTITICGVEVVDSERSRAAHLRAYPTMAARAERAYAEAYPDGYDDEVGVTLYDHIVGVDGFEFLPHEGPEILFADGSVID